MSLVPEQFINYIINQPTALKDTTGSDFQASGTGHAKGLVPDPGSSAGTTRYLREDSTWSNFFNPATSTFNVDTYGDGSNIGTAGAEFTSSDSSAQTGKERYSLWVSNTSSGTGDGSVAGSTYALGISAIKSAWGSTTTAGQFGGINVYVRGGDNNVVSSGDVAAYLANAGVSNTNNYVAQFEGTSGYFPAGSTTNSLYIRCQIAPIKSSGLGDLANSNSHGFMAQAQNGASNGAAFYASNRAQSPSFGNAASWGFFLRSDYDDGVHTAYTPFYVTPDGIIQLAGVGAASSNSKLIRVGGSVTNNLEIINSANSALILSLTDGGRLTWGSGGGSGFTATGTSGTPTFTNLLPAGGHTTIQTWLTVVDNGGNTRFIPCY